MAVAKDRSPLGVQEVMTPDGTYAVTGNRQKRTLTIRNLADGTTRTLLRGDASANYGSVLWSRDGKRLAYGWCRTTLPGGRCGNPKQPPQTELRIMNVDGTGMRVILPRLAAGIDLFDWSADGRNILAQISEPSAIRLVTISVADGSVTDIKAGGDIGTAAFSPDGRFIVYGNWQDAIAWGLEPFELDVAVKNDLHVIALESGEEQTLVQHPADEHFIGWTPAGSILFTSDRSGTIDLWMAQFDEGRLDAPPQRLAVDVGAIEPRAVLPNGDLHYFAATRQTNSARLARLDSANTPLAEVREIIAARGEHQGPLQFDPAGQRAAYLAGRDIFNGVVLSSTSNDSVTQISLQLPPIRGGTRVATQLWVTPAELYVLIGGSRSTATKQLARVDQSSGVLTLLGDTGAEAALWPDGKSVAYVRGSPGRVMQRQLDAKEEIELFNTGTDGRPRSLSVSPDGARVAVFTSGSTAGAAYESGELRVVDTASRQSRVLATPSMRFDSVQRTAWSPDGHWIYYVDHAGDEHAGEELWRVSVAGGTPQKVLTHECLIVGPAVHPSGAFLTFSSECVQPATTYVLRGVVPLEERRAAGGRR